MYTPGLPPSNPAEVPGFLLRELQKIQQELEAYQDVVRMRELNVAPTRPRNGLLAYSDGTNWAAGFGKGIYAYITSAWEKLLTTAGLKVKEGSNAKMGTAVLVAGTVTVSNTSVTANSRIFLTSNADGGTPGFLRVSGRTAATSFTITSSNAADTSTVAWLIVEPS